jgi:formate hydrogenlyase subunit 6/NADH:ubiquinone oxidoreductase subunit I
MGLLDLLLRSLRTPAVTETYPERTPILARGRRGTPELILERCDAEGACATACPTRAIGLRHDAVGTAAWKIDYGACIFCGLCIDVCPNEAIAATDAFELAVRNRSAAFVSHQVRARHG